ncbi:MAG: PAS domain S-box protein, partial [Methanobacteriota archaeon]
MGRVWSYHDLTDRIKGELALLESRERFRILFDNSPISHQALAEDGTILEVNQTLLSMLGYTREEIIGRQFTDLCHPSVLDIFSNCFVDIKAGIPANTLELILFHKDGSEIIVIADGLAVKAHDGSLLQILCALRDITSQRKMEEQLFWTESILEEVVELLPFGICVTEAGDNNIIFENTRFNEIWGQNQKNESEKIQKTLDKVMKNCHAEIQPAYILGDEQSGTESDVCSVEIKLPENRTLRSYQRKFPNNTKDNRTLWAFEDISRFKDQEEEIRQYARRLEILNKMISLSSRATKVQSLCEFVLQSIVPLMGVDGGCLYLISQDRKTAELVASVGINANLKKEIQTVKSSDFADILINGNTFLSENFSDICPDLACRYAIGSVVIVPLPGGGNILGAICLVNRHKFPVNSDEKNILIGAGREIGGALIRLQDQEALRNARRNLDNLVNSISDMVFVIDADSYTILEVNEEVLRHLGYCREDLIGRSVQRPFFMGFLLFPSELFSKNAIILKHIIPTIDGGLIHVETSTALGSWNVRKAIFCVTRDISESLIVQDRVRRSEERLRAIFESSPIGIELYDANGELIDLNQSVQDILGVPDRTLMIGRSLFSLPHIKNDIFDKINLGKTVTYEQILDFADTELSLIYHSNKHDSIEIRIIITPLCVNSTNKISGYLVLIEDITAKKEANRLLAESEAFNRGLVANLPDYIMIYNQEGKILYVNPSGITGMRSEGVLLQG